jgi:DNA-binding protein HU-beta
MNKNELADGIAQRTGLAGTQARQALETAVELIGDELAGGRDVSIAGFGKFSVSNRAARLGRNPATGQTISIAASRSAKFSAAKALKDRLN